jgi:hypothetical protein
MVLEKRDLTPVLGSDSQTIQPAASIYTKYTILAVSVQPVYSVHATTSDTKRVVFPLTSALYTGYLAKTDEWNMSTKQWWNDNDRGKPKHPELNLYQFHSITHPRRNNMESNLCLNGDRPISNYLSHGTTHLAKTYTDAGGHVA